MPGFDVSSWYGICTPGPLPTAVHAKFTADLLQLLEKPALRSKLEEQGIDVTPGTPEQFVAHVQEGNGAVDEGGEGGGAGAGVIFLTGNSAIHMIRVAAPCR